MFHPRCNIGEGAKRRGGQGHPKSDQGFKALVTWDISPPLSGFNSKFKPLAFDDLTSCVISTQLFCDAVVVIEREKHRIDAIPSQI